MKLLRKLFAAKKRNQKEVKSLVGLHSSAMRSEKCEARSRTLVGVVSGTFLERQASTAYMVISLAISMFKLKTTVGKNSRLDVYFYVVLCTCYGQLLLWLSQFQAGPSPPGICRVFVIFVWKTCKCPTVGPGGYYKKEYPEA